ncbi:X-linked interleukin-1 receptor accessory protein-like 2 [Homarus americanus]|nr:X-linked interleukin-1 receptor accessory protein-like 2 [Homarus americanus]XP_042236131.1 X-linked interleukin-1 receptor accessory protein-like 2 [Homarus americanus]
MKEQGVGRLLSQELLLLFLLLMFLLPGTLQQEASNQLTCKCQEKRPKAMQVPFPDDAFKVSKGGEINCCVEWFLGYSDPDATVTWKFKGKTYPWQETSSFQKHSCGKEALESFKIKRSDEGNYTCTVTSSNGTIVTKTMELVVERIPEVRDKPLKPQTSGNVTNTVGSKVSFFCEAFVGIQADGGLPPKVTWTKLLPNGTVYTFAKMLPNVTCSQVYEETGTLKGYMNISFVEKVHFGTYNCSITTLHSAVLLSVVLINGVPEMDLLMQQYKLAVVTTVSIAALLAVVSCILYRVRLQLSLYCCQRNAVAKIKDGYQYDVMVIHGDSASRWVWTVLLPALGDTYGYTCFLPQRDMCGGDHVGDSILNAISRCRRMVVVVTPCLLTSPWATWATYSGIHAALTTPARILALLLQEVSVQGGPPTNNSWLGILKVVVKVRVPSVCGWQLVEEQENQLDEEYFKLERKNTNPSEMKLTIPEIKIETAWSSSPKSQRLSNMITGSNAASREDLEDDKDKKIETRDPVIYSEEYGMQDPGSPCSITPFILPSCNKDTRQGMVCQSLCRCMQVVCVGDPKKLFWQTVRLRLGPPALRNTENKPTYYKA